MISIINVLLLELLTRHLIIIKSLIQNWVFLLTRQKTTLTYLLSNNEPLLITYLQVRLIYFT